jgi:hypothetical protein
MNHHAQPLFRQTLKYQIVFPTKAARSVRGTHSEGARTHVMTHHWEHQMTKYLPPPPPQKSMFWPNFYFVPVLVTLIGGRQKTRVQGALTAQNPMSLLWQVENDSLKVCKKARVPRLEKGGSIDSLELVDNTVQDRFSISAHVSISPPSVPNIKRNHKSIYIVNPFSNIFLQSNQGQLHRQWVNHR